MFICLKLYEIYFRETNISEVSLKQWNSLKQYFVKTAIFR